MVKVCAGSTATLAEEENVVYLNFLTTESKGINFLKFWYISKKSYGPMVTYLKDKMLIAENIHQSLFERN